AYNARTLTSSKAAILKKQLEALMKRLKDVEKEFVDIIALKCPTYSVDSLVMIGRLYDEFANKVDAVPPPPEIPADMIKAYKDALEQQSETVRDRARE